MFIFIMVVKILVWIKLCPDYLSLLWREKGLFYFEGLASVTIENIDFINN